MKRKLMEQIMKEQADTPKQIIADFKKESIKELPQYKDIYKKFASIIDKELGKVEAALEKNEEEGNYEGGYEPRGGKEIGPEVEVYIQVRAEWDIDSIHIYITYKVDVFQRTIETMIWGEHYGDYWTFNMDVKSVK